MDSSKPKEFADDNFKFDENGRKLSKWVENTVGKGEIARYEQFLLFPQCFQKACFPGLSKGVIVWECVKRSRLLKILWKMEKMMETSIFSFSNNVLYTYEINFQSLTHIYRTCLQRLFNLDSSEIFLFGKN